MESNQPLLLCMENAAGEEVVVRVEPGDDFSTFAQKASLIILSSTNQLLLLCMENAAGEVVTVGPGDDFSTFAQKARSVLGYDIDLSLITKNQPVEMTANVYQFLVNLELTEEGIPQNYDRPVDASNQPIVLDENQLYVLDDGTQIRASQIHFDNEDAPLDLSLEQLPFVKTNDDGETIPADDIFDDITHKIIASPVPLTNSSPKHGFINHVPFKLVCNNTIGFEAQFTKYLEASNKTYATLSNVTKKNKSPRSLIRDNFNDKEEFKFTRDEILNMLKDSPVTSIPYENNEKKHVRKTDPTKMVQKTSTKAIDIEGLVIGNGGNRNCFICGTNVSNDKIYLFDKEDQKIHKCSPQKKMSTQLKIICENCLNVNFRPSRMKNANQLLNSEEYLVIRNNQQYIFQKKKNFKFRTDTINKMKKSKKDDFVKFDIGSDGEIVTKPVDDDVILVQDGRRGSSSDVEVIEEVDKIIDNLEEADEEVKVFLGKYDCDEVNELKCRFCERIFSTVSEVIEHGELHKHDIDDDVVFPCPLCDFGYASFQWLRGHLIAAHDKKANKAKESQRDRRDKLSNSSSITTRIRTSSTNPYGAESFGFAQDSNDSIHPDLIIKTEVKQEAISSDDEIWIVQTGDDESTGPLKDILEAAKVNAGDSKTKKCHTCGNNYPSIESLSSHKCRGIKRKTNEDEMIIPTEEDFVRRAQRKPQHLTSTNAELIEKHKKSKNLSEPQIVTCHNCNQSFTSKVRLKFHMQFHDMTSMLTDGQYKCLQCVDIFTTETQLFDHVHFTHEKIRRWQCPVQGCQKTFYLRATLTKHSRTHTDTRRYVCVTCGKRFLDKQTLDEHGVTHLQIKPYQCHICLKQLTRVSRLRMHVRAHEEELSPTLLPVCRVCRRAFRDGVEAQEHATKSSDCIEAIAGEVKTEEETAVQLSPTSGIVRQTIQVIQCPSPKTRVPRQVASPVAAPLLSSLTSDALPLIRVVEIEKAFRCEYCEDVFYIEEGLNDHRAIHKGVKNPFTCHICKVSFATYSRCTTHKTTHGFYKRPAAGNNQATGVVGYGDFPTVKHFLCEDCGRSYLHWTYLQVHRRMKHPNENYPHNCNQCEMTFPNSWSLAYHRKKLHSKTSQEEVAKTSVNYRIPCRDCEEVLPNKTALYKHRKKEHIGVSTSSNTSAAAGSTCQVERTPMSVRSKLVSCGRSWACSRCPKRFRIRSELRSHTRLKHPAFIAVLEVQGRNLSAEEAVSIINSNNISQDRIIEISVMSFAKGASSIVPNCARALALLGNVPRTQIMVPRNLNDMHCFVNPMTFQRCVVPTNVRRPTILRSEHQNMTEGNQNQDLDLQLILQDGTVGIRGEMQLQ